MIQTECIGWALESYKHTQISVNFRFSHSKWILNSIWTQQQKKKKKAVNIAKKDDYKAILFALITNFTHTYNSNYSQSHKY